MRLFLRSSIATAAILLTTTAYAANGIATTQLNLRTGPGTQYPVLGTIPSRAGLSVGGCTTGYSWCRVSYGNLDGWAASSYIAVQTSSGSYTTDSNFGSTAAAIGIPLIAGVIIGSAISSNNNNYYYGPGWGPRPYWGPPRPYYRPYPAPYHPWGPGPYHPVGPGPVWHDHPDFPHFAGPRGRR